MVPEFCARLPNISLTLVFNPVIEVPVCPTILLSIPASTGAPTYKHECPGAITLRFVAAFLRLSTFLCLSDTKASLGGAVPLRSRRLGRGTQNSAA